MHSPLEQKHLCQFSLRFKQLQSRDMAGRVLWSPPSSDEKTGRLKAQQYDWMMAGPASNPLPPCRVSLGHCQTHCQLSRTPPPAPGCTPHPRPQAVGGDVGGALRPAAKKPRAVPGGRVGLWGVGACLQWFSLKCSQQPIRQGSLTFGMGPRVSGRGFVFPPHPPWARDSKHNRLVGTWAERHHPVLMGDAGGSTPSKTTIRPGLQPGKASGTLASGPQFKWTPQTRNNTQKSTMNKTSNF